MNGIRLTPSGVALVAAALFTSGAVGQGGDTIGTATIIGGLPYSDTGGTADYVNDYDEVCPYAGSTSPDVVYAFSPGADVMVDITLCDLSDYDTKLYVYENMHTPGAPFACNDDACEDPWGHPYVSELRGLSLIGGNTYYIVVDGFGGVWGEYTFDMSEAVPLMGACCVDEDCVATNTLPECDGLGGAWYRGEDCATFTCPVVEECGPDSIYGQIPTDPGGSWTVGTSDLNANGGCNRFESYSVGEDIGGVWFWGLTLSYPWTSCIEDPMDFEIIFWPDDGTGMPDLANPARTYSLSLAASTTTYIVAGGWSVLRWETDLDPCCDLHSGWISVQGTTLQTPIDCWFLWYTSDKIGSGQSWFYPGALPLESNDFDLSMCLYPCEGLPGTLLYDVDFSTPPHIVGLPPALGDGPAPRATPSEIWFGEPLVVSAMGALTDQPCAFGDHPTATYDQLLFTTAALPYPHGFPEAYPTYHVEMDVLVDGMDSGDQFNIFVDCPTAHSVIFNGANEIRASVLGPGAYNVLIGTITPGTPVFLEIDVDMDTQTWAIAADGFGLFAGPYPSEALRTVRLSMATNATPDPVAVDNVRIAGGAAPPPPCPADVNGDGVVDFVDLLAVLAAWGNTSGPEDINGDGIVNVLDLLEVLAAWGPCP